MSSIAIRAENLSKRYRVGQKVPYKTLRDLLTDSVAKPFRRLLSPSPDDSANHSSMPQYQFIWALKDVCCEIEHGEVVGIIGKNGAGKSTLLKILSRITVPTSGIAEIYGRVGSLLEVGTGFHPELTGRENILLNGAVLGMKRVDIRRRFDEIVAFAEVEKFIDTPVKYYSSGMYVRLAFAVAAHLEPEILLVDEVLSVGDAAFQKKCMSKMDQVSREGRTVFLVSHNMASVQNLCSLGIVLDGGSVSYLGRIDRAIQLYLESASQLLRHDLRDRTDRKGNQALRFTGFALFDSQGNEVTSVLSGQDVVFRFFYKSDQSYPSAKVNVAFNVYNSQGVLLTNLNSKDVARTDLPIGRTGWFQCVWNRFSLRSGVYSCSLFCEINGEIADWIQGAFQISVEDGDFFKTGHIIPRSAGEVFVSYDWSAKAES